MTSATTSAMPSSASLTNGKNLLALPAFVTPPPTNANAGRKQAFERYAAVLSATAKDGKKGSRQPQIPAQPEVTKHLDRIENLVRQHVDDFSNAGHAGGSSYKPTKKEASFSVTPKPAQQQHIQSVRLRHVLLRSINPFVVTPPISGEASPFHLNDIFLRPTASTMISGVSQQEEEAESKEIEWYWRTHQQATGKNEMNKDDYIGLHVRVAKVLCSKKSDHSGLKGRAVKDWETIDGLNGPISQQGLKSILFGLASIWNNPNVSGDEHSTWLWKLFRRITREVGRLGKDFVWLDVSKISSIREEDIINAPISPKIGNSAVLSSTSTAMPTVIEIPSHLSPVVEESMSAAAETPLTSITELEEIAWPDEEESVGNVLTNDGMKVRIKERSSGKVRMVSEYRPQKRTKEKNVTVAASKPVRQSSSESLTSEKTSSSVSADDNANEDDFTCIINSMDIPDLSTKLMLEGDIEKGDGIFEDSSTTPVALADDFDTENALIGENQLQTVPNDHSAGKSNNQESHSEKSGSFSNEEGRDTDADAMWGYARAFGSVEHFNGAIPSKETSGTRQKLLMIDRWLNYSLASKNRQSAMVPSDTDVRYPIRPKTAPPRYIRAKPGANGSTPLATLYSNSEGGGLMSSPSRRRVSLSLEGTRLRNFSASMFEHHQHNNNSNNNQLPKSRSPSPPPPSRALPVPLLFQRNNNLQSMFHTDPLPTTLLIIGKKPK